MGGLVSLALEGRLVSMKSGLRDRNNCANGEKTKNASKTVSMKSGLRDRNNTGEFGSK